MSINPIEARQSFDVAQPKGSHPSEGGFEEALAGAAGRAGEGKISPALAAEILRVKMLSSALSIGGDADGEGSQGLSAASRTQRVLNRFLENLAQGENGAAVGAAGAAGEMEEVGALAPAPPGGVEEAEGRGGAMTAADDIIDRASRRFGVDRELIRAVIKAESGFDPRAVSSAGAQGLMQLMPSTAKMLGVKDPFDPEQNVMGGTRFLKDLLQRYDGDVDSALAAYNWGPGNLEKSTGSLPRETRDYLKKVKGYYAQYTV